MSAGTGVRHAEYNLEDETTTLFQIWVQPTEPRRASRAGAREPFPKADRSGRFVTLASGFAEDGDALPIRADARVLGATLKAGETRRIELGPGRHAYLVAGARRRSRSTASALEPRDGAAIENERSLRVTALEDAEIVLVDAT